MRASILAVVCCLVLAGCSSSGGATETTVPSQDLPSRASVVQDDLTRELGLRDPRCEQNIREGSGDHFLCFFKTGQGVKLQLAVTQATRRSRPIVDRCEGTRKLDGNSFVTCAIGKKHGPVR